MTAPASSSFRVYPRLNVALVLGFGLAALFVFAHPYRGIVRDGEIYTLLALRRLYPAALNGDLFFRYGSQDSFTLFSWFYAALVERFGLEAPAWALARLSGIALAGAALLLAREIMDRRSAWLALALFIVIPGSYGPHDMFSYGENFVTPRTLSEALTVFAVYLAVRERWPLAVASLAAGLALHPLQAAAGIPCIIALRGPPRALVWIGGAAGCGLAVAAAVAQWAPIGPIRMLDPEWRASLHLLVTYLEASDWWLLDWQRAAVPLATLGIAVIALERGRARRLASCALGTGCAGLVLFLVGSVLAPIVLLIQGQPWRWMWLAKGVAALLLVPLGGALWSRGTNGKAILALLAIAWYGTEEALGLEAALCALAATLFEFRSRRRFPKLWVVVGALALGFAAGVFHLIGLSPQLLAAGAAFTAWWIVFHSDRTWLAALAAISVAAIFAQQLIWHSADRRAPDYDALSRALEPWQSIVGVDQTVLFPLNSAAPTLAMHRQTYLGAVGVVFSREAALARRVRSEGVLQQAGAGADALFSGRPDLPLPTLQRLCTLPGLDFVALPVSYPVPRVAAYAGPPLNTLYLYDCRTLRTESGHA